MSENKEINVESTYKSLDTEEWFDIHFNRPIGFWWAKFFNKFDVHPNTVTILSIFIGAIAGVCYYFDPDVTPHWFVINVLGCLLLTLANFYDSADGQLARMTGKKSRLGRILDGLSGDVWFYVIYIAVCLRLMDNEIPFWDGHVWSFSIFFVAAFSGMVCHRYQCSLADYYRNIHLFFLKGEDGSEFDTSDEWRSKYRNQPWSGHLLENLFAWGYANYTQQQEGATKNWQALYKAISEKWIKKGVNIPSAFVNDFLEGSRPLMKWTNILTHNTRATVLYIACLVNLPWLYFAFEMTVLVAILLHMRHQHEKLCKRLLENIDNYVE